MKWYPRAHENRLSPHHPSFQATRRAFFRAAAKNFVLLQILFLALFSYIFGALYQQTSHVHNLDILFVDYDSGGTVGNSIRQAYSTLQGNGFPTLVERPSSEFAGGAAELRHSVCKINYWAAIYVSPSASSIISNSLSSGDQYNKSTVLTYIWNQARYPTVGDSAISANIVKLSSVASTAFASPSNNWTSVISNPTPQTYATFSQPWVLTDNNIQPTNQGSRLIYNTLVFILILIQEFFYLGTINGLYEAFKMYSKLNPHRIIIFRNFVSLMYTLVGSCCVAGTIWAFRAGWHVNGNQFVLTWMVLWLFAHANFLTLDVFTIWLPPPYIPMSLITWVILNITSILQPFPLSPGFYTWSHAIPAHSAYNILLDIWSGGCNPTLSWALPVLFVYELSGLLLTGIGAHKRAHFATCRKEEEEIALRKKVDEAVREGWVRKGSLERLREKERSERPDSGYHPILFHCN
ncbi:putative Nitrosoguanidine resistance protein SNG1 [Aulographum hederae CBS 113979]|uniref:Putative Nitrosoguanidine resistance protein SNG1 n=1 Tax=Aulographum hederae CBS 113979 TaxID=1176131 RepID=A0A6G1GUW3_9PEZI|nr:putative Nitrosoguanidine resistance protein SNG1 [Aulographum hederae CBS 113979]